MTIKRAGDFIDISVLLNEDVPVWPGSVGYRTYSTKQIGLGDPVNETRLDCDVHVGTHIDAPLHFLPEGRSIDKIPLDDLIGPAYVAYLPNVNSITEKDLKSLNLPINVERLLLRTRNSELWEDKRGFNKNYVAITAEAANWMVSRGVRLVGIDYLSIQRYSDGPETHRVLLGAKVVIVEGLNLMGVSPGFYELICLPLRLMNVEGAPARAVLRPLGHFSS